KWPPFCSGHGSTPWALCGPAPGEQSQWANMSDPYSPQQADLPGRTSDPLLDRPLEARVRQKVRTLWQLGDLVHITTRFPRKSKRPAVDRLAGILKLGILAPACCQDGSVRSDLHLTVTGTTVPYDRLVFLHRFGQQSYLYTHCEPARFALFIDP